eukprot:c24913_g1_i2 orf=576-2723(+)
MEQRIIVRVVRALVLVTSFASLATGLRLCLNYEAPVSLPTSLNFCSSFKINSSSCCDEHLDKLLEAEFNSFNVLDINCSNFLKQILCAQCDPYAAELFGVQMQEKRSVPLLCNSSSTSSSISYCSMVWDGCRNVSIHNSPFAPSLQGGISTTPVQPPSANSKVDTLTNLWQSEHDFCVALGGSMTPGDFCYNGTEFIPFAESAKPPPQGICFEKIDSGVYLNMVPHPDGSNRVFVATQDGKIFLAEVPIVGSGKPLSMNESSPFLDISDRVTSTGEYGLLGVAFHPNFKANGRFFVSYSCDKSMWSDCAGQCSCNVDAGCSLSQLGPEAGPIPCQFSSVIAEYTANSSSSSPLQALVAQPAEVRRIFTMGLPYSTHHSGQILFGPTDNYLYFMIGDGGSSGDPFNFAQKKKSLLGKILRFDIDNIPNASEISKLGLWGNYSIPPDNPFINDSNSQSEIWAYGLRNPWRCAFDDLNPLYFYCADVGQSSLVVQELYEEVDLITKGGNYGWRVYEGFNLYTPLTSPGGNTTPSSIQPIFPIMGYNHSSVNSAEGTASIIGGYLSRSTEDACVYGRYVYADLYVSGVWVGLEMPTGSGNYTSTKVPFNCSRQSPLPCSFSGNRQEPNLMYVLSFGTDNSKNIYLLAGNGVYKIGNPKGCNYVCNATLPSTSVLPSSPLPAPSPAPSSIPRSLGCVSGSRSLMTSAIIFLIFISIITLY